MKQRRLVANNKKARHDYFIEYVYETGIVLTGTEIKSLRQGKVNLKESYAKIEAGEVIVYGMHISPYAQGNRFNADSLRPRKLLLHRQEIRKLTGYTTQKGLTVIPLNVYINEKGFAKMEIAVARGKKLYDKREDMAKRDADRKIQQSVKKYSR
ncbi:MAG: SsrA-binding protein SmpB [Clostridiales Family XIII bacterium]|jgi:SsrA-binding protein|nr:SsrA-binding protein SmpB [Clostridiales Family XIII bacterium]